MSTDDEHERLLRDLRAPGSDAELAEEERYRAMFRAAHPATAAPRRRRASRRLLAGGAAGAVLAIGTGGVAAAYTGNLPTPIQTLAHHVMGAPAASSAASSSGSPVHRAPTTARTSSPTAAAPLPPSPQPSPSPSARPTHQPRHPRRQHGPAPVTAPSAAVPAIVPATRAPIPVSTPTPTPAPVLSGVLVVADTHQADVGTQVGFSGQLVFSAASTSRPRVVLQAKVGSRWTPVASGRAATDGSITLTAPPLQRTTVFRLRASQRSGAVNSVTWRVAMRPQLTAIVTASKKQATIDATALGGVAGDDIVLTTRRDGRPVIVGEASLDASGSASFVVAPDQRRSSYAVVLRATKQHTSARTGVVVQLAPGARAG